jgi:lysozyme family protein
MTDRFDICVAFVLERETEFNKDGSVKVERDPHDPGGTTKFGIDQRDHPGVNIAALTVETAKAIYRHEVWDKCRCANLKAPWDLAVMDSCVNPGFKSIRFLQQVVGTKVDGFIGPVTIAKVNSASIDLLFEFLDLRESYYQALPAQLKKHYLKGWLNRVADLRTAVSRSISTEERVFIARRDPSSITPKADKGVIA